MLLPNVSKDEMLRAARTFYSTGDMQPLCEFIEGRFSVFGNRNYRWSNELTIIPAFLVMLFNDTFCIMDSETALKRDYADMTMIIRPDMHKYQLLDILIEFKYVGLEDLSLSGDQIQKMPQPDLESVPAMQKQFAASKTKLDNYRQILADKYGEKLRLYCYSVVSLGFERLLWTEV